MKKQLFALFSLCLFLTFPSSSFAARSVSITGDKSSLFDDEELVLSASMSGFMDGETIYLKGALFKEGSTNYFGYTKNGDSWIKNSTTALEQRAVQIGSFDGSVIVKSDFSDSGYSGAGSYNLKLGFYYITSGGNTSSINWSSNVLSINLDPPAPTQASITSKASNPVSIPQASKTPTSAKAITSKTTPIVTKAVSIAAQAIKSNNSAKITHEIKAASQYARLKISLAKKEPSPQLKVLGTNESSFPGVSLIGGIAFLLLAAGLVGRRELRRRNIL